MSVAWDWDEGSRAALAAFLAARGLVDGEVDTRPIGDGHSNLTYLVTDGERRVIVRRPPPPPIPAGANDMLREARFVSALAGTRVPVPEVLAVAQVGEVIDVPFSVMSVVDGPVVTTVTPAPLDTPEVRRQIGESLVDTLTALHAVDWRARGLTDAGRPEGFNARHLRRMHGLVADENGDLPTDLVEIGTWLADRVPTETGAAIVHNDFRIGNVVLEPAAPGRVAAVLDWELATIGDPLFDLGYFLATVPEPGERRSPTEELGAAMLEPGYPTRAELADRYANRTGADLSGLPWFSTLALWKLAVLYEYGRRRAQAGHGDAYYADDALVRSFIEAAHRTAGL